MELAPAPEAEAAPEADRAPASADLPGVGAAVPAQAPEYPERSSPFGAPEGAPEQKGDLPNYQAQWQSGEAGPGLSPKPTKWDKLVGGLEEGASASFAGTLLKEYNEKSAETGTLLPPDQANKMNPYRSMPYTTPVDSGIVAMEAADGRAQQQRQEWLSRNEGGNFLRGVGGFAGGFVDAPMYTAIGALTGGLGELMAPEALGLMGKLAVHYGMALGEFSAVGQIQNKLETGMGAKEKSFGQVVEENVVGAGIATGLGMLARHFLDKGEASHEALSNGIKETATSMANDERIPDHSAQRAALDERRSGVTVAPNGDKLMPPMKTSPLVESTLYVATHGDGTPLTHDHGLGPGSQFTDSREVARNGVARSTETPGQIGETRLPESAKLLDIDQSAAQDYESKDSILKKIEEKTGVPLDAAVKNGESLKDVIQNLGDWAGASTGDGKVIPEDILKQIQGIVKEQGYSGYALQGDNSQTVHMFDPKEAGMEVSKVEHADPSATPELPVPGSERAPTPEAQEAQDRMNSQNYSPSVVEALNKIRKTAMTLHPDNLADQIAEVQNTLADHKQLLQQLAKENPEAEAAMQELRESEVHDKRMLDLAKRIMNCGATE